MRAASKTKDFDRGFQAGWEAALTEYKRLKDEQRRKAFAALGPDGMNYQAWAKVAFGKAGK
jgi:hypothetical protein